MTTKSDKLVDVIVKENLMHMIELSDYVSNNSKELGINKKEINRIVSKNSDYFSLYFEANQQNSITEKEYFSGREKLAKDGYIMDSLNFINSHQPIEIFHDGRIHVIH